MQLLKKYHIWILAGALFLIALLLRGARIRLGLPYIHHWDEYRIAGEALNMLRTGEFKPTYYDYGSMLKYLNLVVDMFHYMYLMGQPDSAKVFMTSINELQTSADTDWVWTASHPSFYAWNRMLTAVFGAGTVVLLFLMAKTIFKNTWMALVPALFLAALPYHIAHSAWVTPDVPAGFFVTGCVFFALLFFREGVTKWFVWSLVFAGFAAATKINSSIVLLAPAITLVWHRLRNAETIRLRHGVMLVAIPSAIFVLTMPYALFNLSAFMDAMGSQLRHYKILGHEGHTSEPGLAHIQFQLERFRDHMGSTVLVLAFIGIIGVLIRADLAFALIVPVLSFFYMTNFKVNFDRNFIPLYPFIALLLLSGLHIMHNLPKLLPQRVGNAPRRTIPYLVWGATGLFLANMVWHSVLETQTALRDTETRTQAIQISNSTPGVAVVAIPKELRIHDEDLRQLKFPRVVEPLASLIRRAAGAPDTLYMLPSGLGTAWSHAISRPHTRLMTSYASFQNKIREDDVLTRIGGKDTNLDAFFKNPGIILYVPSMKSVEFSLLETPYTDFRLVSPDPIIFDGQTWQAEVAERTMVRFPVINLSTGRYAMTFDWKYSEDLARTAKLQMDLWDPVQKRLIARRVLKPNPRGFAWGSRLQQFKMQVLFGRSTYLIICLSAKVDEETAPTGVGGKFYVKNVQFMQV